MKKIVFICIMTILCLPNFVSAKDEKIKVSLAKCVDGDTAWFINNGEKIKTRFLAIDTPESTTKKEAYGEEASEYTCELLTNAETIEIEYDASSDKTDKYDRHLVWVFVDKDLLQEKVIEKGLAEVAYLYGNYKYTDVLEEAEDTAKENKVGIWSEEDKRSETSYWYIILIVGAIILIYIIYPKGRKKIQSKVKSSIRKEIQKHL